MSKKNRVEPPSAAPQNPFTAAEEEMTAALEAEGAAVSDEETAPALVPPPPVKDVDAAPPAPSDPLFEKVAASLVVKRLVADDVGGKLMFFQEGLFYGSPKIKQVKIVDTDPIRRLFPPGAWFRKTGVAEYTAFLPEGAAKDTREVRLVGRELEPVVVALSRCITG